MRLATLLVGLALPSFAAADAWRPVAGLSATVSGWRESDRYGLSANLGQSFRVGTGAKGATARIEFRGGGLTPALQSRANAWRSLGKGARVQCNAHLRRPIWERREPTANGQCTLSAQKRLGRRMQASASANANALRGPVDSHTLAAAVQLSALPAPERWPRLVVIASANASRATGDKSEATGLGGGLTVRYRTAAGGSLRLGPSWKVQRSRFAMEIPRWGTVDVAQEKRSAGLSLTWRNRPQPGSLASRVQASANWASWGAGSSQRQRFTWSLSPQPQTVRGRRPETPRLSMSLSASRSVRVNGRRERTDWRARIQIRSTFGIRRGGQAPRIPAPRVPAAAARPR